MEEAGERGDSSSPVKQMLNVTSRQQKKATDTSTDKRLRHIIEKESTWAGKCQKRNLRTGVKDIFKIGPGIINYANYTRL